MNVAIVGLGLIGGSMAKSIKMTIMTVSSFNSYTKRPAAGLAAGLHARDGFYIPDFTPARFLPNRNKPYQKNR